MRKQAIKPLARNKEYRTPKTISWERTFEFYGDQRMSMCASNVKDKAVNLRNENVLSALKESKARSSK